MLEKLLRADAYISQHTVSEMNGDIVQDNFFTAMVGLVDGHCLSLPTDVFTWTTFNCRCEVFDGIDEINFQDPTIQNAMRKFEDYSVSAQ